MKRIPMNPGDVWARLTVIREEGRTVLCRCECGTEKWYQRQKVRSGWTKSCGCLMRERVRVSKNVKHGLTGTPEYVSWRSAKGRCFNPADKDYVKYGGRGITMCARWASSFENFLADMGEKPRGMTLERSDVNGNYEPDNCEWATLKTQARNRRVTVFATYRGETKALSEWCEELGLNYMSAVQLMRKFGKTAEETFKRARRVDQTEAVRPHSAKLTANQAVAIYSDPRCGSLIAGEYDISKSLVSRIKTGRAWAKAVSSTGSSA